MSRNANPNPHTQPQPNSPHQPVTLSDGERSSDSSPVNGRNTGATSTNASASGTVGPYAGVHTNGSHSQMHHHQRPPQPRPSSTGMPPAVGAEGEEGDDASPPRRHHGKRLTTKEEVTLFEICNRHSRDFGQRSNLCNWWRMVTDEFIREQGHPYSWHSVRRKVEIITKQRMKALEDQSNQGGGDPGTGGNASDDDMSNAQWRATIDAWIPTWQRWEEAEAKRIKERDSCNSRRKRKDRSWEGSGVDGLSDGGLSADGNGNGNRRNSTHVGSGTQMGPPPAPVRLPPGFESMFANQAAHTPVSKNGVYNNAYHTPSYSPPSSMGVDNAMMGAMLETLNKINKRLESSSPNPNPRASPVISALVSNGDSPSQSQSGVGPSPRTGQEESRPSIQLTTESLSKLKEELRLEVQAELRREMERDRAGFEERLDSVQRTQDMILEMLRQEP